MSRPKLPKSVKRSVMVFVGFRPAESARLDAYKKRHGHRSRAAAIRGALRNVIKGAA